jgi:hypothetical protein
MDICKDSFLRFKNENVKQTNKHEKDKSIGWRNQESGVGFGTDIREAIMGSGKGLVIQ